jgi:uroporphyrin-III C-methyltransferase
VVRRISIDNKQQLAAPVASPSELILATHTASSFSVHPPKQTLAGILVVGHGSRREEANEDVRRVANLIAERGHFPLVEPAFLEIVSPTITEGVDALTKRGATHVIVHPYFLSPGRHTRGDLPVAVQAAASGHRNLTYQITEPLSAHSLVVEAAIDRIRTTSSLSNASPLLKKQSGKVYLVGAGPGDPGLLTVKGLELLRQADIVVYDYLVNTDLLSHLRFEAERVYVGKVGGGKRTPQSEINRLLIAQARAGKLVVRLKGGDPFLFGRGGEEALALTDAGIAFEIVPGISAALAVPAYAGIPLTHRGLSSSVTILTGSCADQGQLFADLLHARHADTIVVLMGIANLREIASELIRTGRSTETPVAVIRWGTYETQQIVTATLRTIADRVTAERMKAPAVIVIGDVVRLNETLNWFSQDYRKMVNSKNLW